MDLGFSKEQDMLRESVAEFLSKECPYETVKEIEETEEGYSKKLWKKIAELGWMEIYYPEEYGGYGDPLMDLYIIIEEMGKAAFPSPFISTVVQCGFPILEGGSEDQKKDLLSKIAKGKLIMSLAQFEPEASYQESGITMAAVAAGDDFVLNGTKLFVMDANIADKLLVVAKADAGVTLFVVDTKDSGITTRIMPSIGMDNCCEVVFKDVKASKADVIGAAGQGWEILKKAEPKVVLAKCAEMLSGCKASLDMTSAYTKERVQYGKPIGGQQAIQHFMADMSIAYDTNLNLYYKMVWMLDEGMDDAAFEIAGLKARLNEGYKFISERGVHLHGGIGTTREYDVGIFYRRSKAAEFAMGDTDYNLELVAQGLGM